MGRHWLTRNCNKRMALAIAQRLDVAEVVGRVLVARGITLENSLSFLNPTLKDQLPDPSHLMDMNIATKRLTRAVMKGEKIAIFGDYDVDGATSSALLKNFLDHVRATIQVIIPDRIKEGYGPNTEALLKLREEGTAVVVTVDCGTTSFEPIETAMKAGLDVTFSQNGSGMRYRVSGSRYPFTLRNGMYELTMSLSPGFTRPGASA